MTQEIKVLGFLCFALVLASCFRSTNANDLNPDNWTTLRVCADPNSMPSQTSRRKVLRTKLRIIGKRFGWKLDYKWFPQRLAFFRNTIRAKTQVLKAGLRVTLQSALP